MKNLKVGDTILTHSCIFTSYAVAAGIATIMHTTESGSKEAFYVPLVLPEFGLGLAGVDSFIHPTFLPPNHPNFVTWKDREKMLVTHNRTGEVCVLRLGKSFHFDGTFFLIPIKGDTTPVQKSSTKYTKSIALLHLDSLKGKATVLSAKLIGLKLESRLRDSVVISNVTKKQNLTLYCSSLEWPTFWSLPARAFIL